MAIVGKGDDMRGKLATLGSGLLFNKSRKPAFI